MAEDYQQIRKRMEDRAKELRPLVAELERLEDALQLLKEQESGPTSSSSGNGRRKAQNGRRGRTGRRGGGRPRKGEPTRAEQFVALVRERPGVTIAQAAEQMGVPKAYLYRVTKDLQEQGAISKDGEGFRVAQQAAAEEASSGSSSEASGS